MSGQEASPPASATLSAEGPVQDLAGSVEGEASTGLSDMGVIGSGESRHAVDPGLRASSGGVCFA